MTTTRLLAVFGLVDIAVGIAVWAATGNAVVGIVIVLVGIVLLVVPAMRRQRPARSGGQRPSKSEGALDKARAEQQRLHGETAAGIENVEDRPPPTGA